MSSSSARASTSISPARNSGVARTLRAIVWSVVLAAPLALAGCTGLTPVYSDNGLGNARLEISYAAPRNRLEQVIYNDLSLRLGQPAKGAPMVRVLASESARDTTNDTFSKPTVQRQATVSARVTVTDSKGKTLFSGTRSATADYTTGAQTLANQQAGDAAADRAAHLLADIIRLQVIAALAN